jgi:regulatory protein
MVMSHEEDGVRSAGSAGRGRSGAAAAGDQAAVLAELRAVASGAGVDAAPARSRGGRRDGAGQAAAPVDPVQQAKDICLRLLTVRPRTRVELAQALVRKGVEDDVAEQVLGRLDEVGLIDDAAFAEVWVRSRHNFQGLSRRALAVELRRKGVADESAAEALAAVDGDAEEERARQLVRKRLRVLDNADETTKIRKLVGMLARKGYAEGLAYRVVKDEVRTSLLDETFE